MTVYVFAFYFYNVSREWFFGKRHYLFITCSRSRVSINRISSRVKFNLNFAFFELNISNTLKKKKNKKKIQNSRLELSRLYCNSNWFVFPWDSSYRDSNIRTLFFDSEWSEKSISFEMFISFFFFYKHFLQFLVFLTLFKSFIYLLCWSKLACR